MGTVDTVAILADGITTTAPIEAASSATRLPVTVDGTRARLVRVIAGGLAYVKFGNAGVVASQASPMISQYTASFFNVSGCTHFSVYGAGAINITPVEG